MNPKKNILTIYASQDKDVLHYLLLHLQPLAKEFNVSIWSDNPIYPGQQWKPLNKSRLDHADVFLLLLSNTFMYSEFIKQDEFKMVIDRYKEGRATVIPVLLDDCPWDVEFTSDDYNFNFRQLQVFPKNEKPIGDWNATDETFKQVAHFITELFTSSIENIDQKEHSKKSGKKILDPKKEEQIAINFFDEEEVNAKAEKERNRKIEVEAKKRVEENNKLSEQAEAKEVIRKEQRQRQKAEIQKRIEKEKGLKEKAKKDKKIEEAAETKEAIKEEKWENEEAKAKKEVAERSRDEITKSESGSEPKKRLEEDVAAQGRRVAKKSRLAGYNYQFKPAKVVEAKDVAKEEKWENEEARTKMEVAERSREKITKSERRTELLKRLGEIVARLKKGMTEIGIAIRHNYQFKTAKRVEAKDVAIEENWENEEAKTKKKVADKNRDEITKSESGNELKKRLGEVVAKLKKGMTEIGFAIRHNYQFKSTGDAHQDPKSKKSTNEKRRIRSRFLIAALIVCGLLIYIFTGDAEKQSTNLPESEATEVDSETVTETTVDGAEQDEPFSKLTVGDTYGEGIIFTIDQAVKTGKIAHFKDTGPMPWNDAIKIHEQLGEGWRLPTMDELQLMYQTIGQGANNSGRFSDELYWSATLYDTYQARLVRFRDGNTSYHYNKEIEQRKFLVRAVRDFGQ